MSYDVPLTPVGRLYATAYFEHYSNRNLPSALRLYQELMHAHPSTPEAEYSRMQLHNIAKAVVPAQELLDAETNLALGHFT